MAGSEQPDPALALREAWTLRGEATIVVGLIEKELTFAEGDLAKRRHAHADCVVEG
jgi:hypothetical protein